MPVSTLQKELSNYPEEQTPDGVRLYGEKSEAIRMAVLTHFLHNASLYHQPIS